MAPARLFTRIHRRLPTRAMTSTYDTVRVAAFEFCIHYRHRLASRAPRVASSNTTPTHPFLEPFLPTSLPHKWIRQPFQAQHQRTHLGTTSYHLRCRRTYILPPRPGVTCWSNLLGQFAMATGQVRCCIIDLPVACKPSTDLHALSRLRLRLPSLRITNRTRTRQLKSMLRFFSSKVRRGHIIPSRSRPNLMQARSTPLPCAFSST
jgi:hypothetical protein